MFSIKLFSVIIEHDFCMKTFIEQKVKHETNFKHFVAF